MPAGDEVAAIGLGDGGSGNLPAGGGGESLRIGDDADQILAAGELAVSEGAGWLPKVPMS
jgi:hypothetical protein